MKRTLQFDELSLQDFALYRQRQTIPLAKQGLVLIEGRNERSKTLNSNGVGKSSLIDALCWVLFGKKISGRSGNTMVNRFSENPECEVSLRFHVDHIAYELARRRPHYVELTTEGHTIAGTQAESKLRGVLGFGLQTFQHAIVFSQTNFDRFSLATHDERMRVLDEIQGVDFTEQLRASKDILRRSSRSVAMTGARLDELRLRRGELRKTCKTLVQERTAFDTNRTAELKELQGRRRRNKQALAERERELAKAEQLRTRAQAKERRRQRAERDLTRLRTKLTKIDTQRTKWLTEKETAQQLMKNVTERITLLRAQRRCPTCNQPTRKLRQSRSDLERVARWQQTVDRNTSRLCAVSEERKTLLLKIERLSRVVDGSQFNTTLLSEDLSRATSAVATLRQERKTIADEIAKASASQWSGASLLAETQRDLRTVSRRLLVATERRARLSKVQRLAEYWVHGFGPKGIRNVFAETVVSYINKRARLHLGFLTAGEASAKLCTTQQHKKGSLVNRLNLDVQWSWGAGEFGDTSAGQERRVDLALFLALQDLAERYATRSLPLRIMDEVGQNIDPKGQSYLAQWIQQEVQQHETALVITHNPLLRQELRPSQVWTVVLDRHGESRVEFH